MIAAGDGAIECKRVAGLAMEFEQAENAARRAADNVIDFITADHVVREQVRRALGIIAQFLHHPAVWR